MAKDIIRQKRTPATGTEIGNQSVVDYNLSVQDVLYIPVGNDLTLNGGKDKAGAIRIRSGILYYYLGNGNWKPVLSSPDGLISTQGITLNGLVVRVLAPTVWSIGGILYTLTTNRDFTIVPATIGYNKIAVIYAKNDNTLDIIYGDEDEDTALEPSIPSGTVKVTKVYIDGGEVQQPQPDLSGYAKLVGGNVFSGNQDNPNDSTRARVLVGRQKIELWDDRYQPNTEALLIQNQRIQNEVDFIPIPADRSTFSRIAMSFLRDTGQAKFYYPTKGVNAVNNDEYVTLQQLNAESVDVSNGLHKIGTEVQLGLNILTAGSTWEGELTKDLALYRRGEGGSQGYMTLSKIGNTISDNMHKFTFFSNGYSNSINYNGVIENDGNVSNLTVSGSNITQGLRLNALNQTLSLEKVDNGSEQSIKFKGTIDGRILAVRDQTNQRGLGDEEDYSLTKQALDYITLMMLTNSLSTKADLVGGVIPASQLPAIFLDEILEYTDLASFPITGEDNKYYVALDTNKSYRWSGTAYIEMYAGVALGETLSTAYRGDRGALAYSHSLLTGNPHLTTFTDLLSKPTSVEGFGITNAVTTNSSQTGLTGNKTWEGNHIFAGDYNTIGGDTPQTIAPLMIRGYGYNSGSIGDFATGQLMVADIEDSSKMSVLGYNGQAGNGFGYINCGNVGDAWTPFYINPVYGRVGIGTNGMDLNYSFEVNGKTKLRDDLDIYNSSRLAFYEGADSSSNYIELIIPDLTANYSVNLQAKNGTVAYLEDLSIVDVIYNDLVTLITNNNLIKGQRYRITDYVTTHNIPNVTPTVVNTGSIEPLIVLALSNNTLHELAYSEQFPKDLIYYEISNSGIAGSTKGCIVKRIDTSLEVTFPNDFRNVKYRRWKLNPPVWNNGANNINTLVLVNNAIYICTQTHATSQDPEAANSAYWTQIIQNNTNYLGAAATGFSYGRSSGGGGTIVIPVNTSDFIDTLAIPNYSSNVGSISNILFSGTKVLNNTVIYTNNQAFAFVRNTFTGGGTNTFNLLGNYYCYDNNFGYLTSSIIQGNNTGAASVNLAISFNNFRLIQSSTIIGQLVAYNSINTVMSSYLGKIFYKVNGDRIENCNFPNYVGMVHFTSTLSNIRATSEKSIQDVNFITTVGNEYNTDDATTGGLYRPVTIPNSIRRKTFIGKYLDDANTPNAFTSTDKVVYLESSGTPTLAEVLAEDNTITDNTPIIYNMVEGQPASVLKVQSNIGTLIADYTYELESDPDYGDGYKIGFDFGNASGFKFNSVRSWLETINTIRGGGFEAISELSLLTSYGSSVTNGAVQSYSSRAYENPGQLNQQISICNVDAYTGGGGNNGYGLLFSRQIVDGSSKEFYITLTPEYADPSDFANFPLGIFNLKAPRRNNEILATRNDVTFSLKATTTDSGTTYQDDELIYNPNTNISSIVLLIVDGTIIDEGDYSFDTTTGTITYSSGFANGAKLIIFYKKP